jgi:hypothetical protein
MSLLSSVVAVGGILPGKSQGWIEYVGKKSSGLVFKEDIHFNHQESLLYHPPLAEIDKENGYISERLW